MPYHDLEGKTFIVTGASSGMGRSTSILLAQQRANVALVDLHRPTQVADEIAQFGGKCIAIECNVQDAAAVDAAVDVVISQYGALHGKTIPPTCTRQNYSYNANRSR